MPGGELIHYNHGNWAPAAQSALGRIGTLYKKDETLTTIDDMQQLQNEVLLEGLVPGPWPPWLWIEERLEMLEALLSRAQVCVDSVQIVCRCADNVQLMCNHDRRWTRRSSSRGSTSAAPGQKM